SYSCTYLGCITLVDVCNAMINDDIEFIILYAALPIDGFGDPNVTESTCDGPPEGYVTDNTDCDDTNADINPATIWYLDADNDGCYAGSGITQCESPGAEYKFTVLIASGDCDDTTADIK